MKKLSTLLLLVLISQSWHAQIIISRIEATNITQSSFDINWVNNQVANSYIRYGATPNLELGIIEGGNTQSPSISVSGGFASQVYYVQAFAQVGSVLQMTDTLSFITASNSSGDIKVYFNRPVNTDFASSPENHAVVLPNAIDDTLIAYIERAQHSIDIMVYNLGHASGISDMAGAINQAFLNGRSVRVIYNQDTGNVGVDQLHPDIPKLISPVPQFPNGHGLMHNKVFIFDAYSSNPNRPIVWTGSTNFTTAQINTDPNNVVIVQDQSLAKAYTMEFDEMWGSSSMTPNLTSSRFGPFKKDNTPHYFNIGGRRVECFFSPSDGTNARIIQGVLEATHDLTVNTMLITRNDIVNSIVQTHNNGVPVMVMVNHPNEGNMQAQYDNLQASLQWRITSFSNIPQSGLLHHKLLFANAFGGTDPYVLTGSHNWSTSAENRNDENTLVIYDADIVNQYLQEFMGRLGALVSAEYYEPFSKVVVYPNPATNVIHVNLASEANIDEIRLINAMGIVVQSIPTQVGGLQNISVPLDHYPSGIYFLQIQSQGVVHVEKFVLR
jgi:phosphatidylserine/phosphatidylglycerophosphate/cardiolipin synthase-like enzyme